MRQTVLGELFVTSLNPVRTGVSPILNKKNPKFKKISDAQTHRVGTAEPRI